MDKRICLKENSQVRPPEAPRSLAELKSQLLQSIERLDRGEGVEGEEAFRRLRQRIKQARANG